MGSACCCLRTENYEDYANRNSYVYRNCICLICFVQNLLNAYASLFRRGEVHAISSSIQGSESLAITTSSDNFLTDMYRSPPRPLPYDADPRYFRLQRDGLVSRRDKGSSHFHEESEPLRSEADADLESFLTGGKQFESICDEGFKENRSKTSLKLLSAKPLAVFFNSSSEDEDVCPTCLEEYHPENPKIITNCSHHFHLACIYEWMERSENCPVCGKVMAFDGTTMGSP